MPKVKIIEVNYHYCDGYGDLYDATQTDWDEVTDEELVLLEKWSKDSMVDTNHFYVLAVISETTPAMAIKDYLEVLKKKKEKAEKAKQTRDVKRKERATKEAEEQRKKELALLEKLQKKYKN